MRNLRGFADGVRSGLLVGVALLLLAFANACAPADAVGTFASDAQKSLESGTAIFDDLPASILRRDCLANTDQLKFDFKPAEEACVKGDEERANLTDAKSDRDALVAIQQELIDYFSSLQQLAAFGTSSDKSDKGKSDSSKAASAATKLKKTAKATSISQDEADAVTGLGTLVERVLTERYRSRQIAKDVVEADKDIAAVIGALKRVVQVYYMFDADDMSKSSLLNVEAHRMQQVFRNAQGDEFLRKINWTDQVTKLLERNASAQSYLKALDDIQQGHHKLATDPGRMKAKDAASVLQPYISSLGSLIPKIQKGF